ncbi:MAG: F0F1 ATP synthase subunit gamma [Acidimicrobiaceae bacterium]|nr:F0F1 ATP synthase subunit gamma [Acidimicrobiaceae bacterium]MBT5849493.1 F0F1 ATP synthase subunit gamma [Acidimicrobiaceae bacterium]
MPGGKERELRRRISSVQSTKKITRAMELIAATRVVKAMQRADASRPYARQITSVIENLAAGGAEVDHPLLREAEKVKKVGFIVMAGDRGLAGAYNSNPIRAAERQIMAHQTEGHDYSLFCVGKKPSAYYRFRNYRVDHAYQGFSAAPSYEDARQIAQDVADAFISGEVDEVELIYTEFISMGTQRISVRRFLPLEDTAVMAEQGGGSAEVASSFEFEPSPEAVLEALLPRYVEARLFGALLDCAASEHANRQRAMKSATDNADELITKLSREMNSARQASITTEIMEIVSGAEALGSGDEKIDLAALLHDATPEPANAGAAASAPTAAATAVVEDYPSED